jgi:propanediol dehydratase large subunit
MSTIDVDVSPTTSNATGHSIGRRRRRRRAAGMTHTNRAAADGVADRLLSGLRRWAISSRTCAASSPLKCASSGVARISASERRRGAKLRSVTLAGR